MRVASLLGIALLACSRQPATPGPGDSNGTDDSGPGSDPVLSSFVFFGGCRLDTSDLDPENIPSAANVAELGQTLEDIATLAAPPRYWFFVGDLVDGLSTGPTLQTQLDAWAQLYTAGPTSMLTTFVPVTGNHETLSKVKANGTTIEQSNPDADGVWTTWLHSERLRHPRRQRPDERLAQRGRAEI